MEKTQQDHAFFPRRCVTSHPGEVCGAGMLLGAWGLVISKRSMVVMIRHDSRVS